MDAGDRTGEMGVAVGRERIARVDKFTAAGVEEDAGNLGVLCTFVAICCFWLRCCLLGPEPLPDGVFSSSREPIGVLPPLLFGAWVKGLLGLEEEAC